MKIKTMTFTGVGLTALGFVMLLARREYYANTLATEWSHAWWRSSALLHVYQTMFIAGFGLLLFASIYTAWIRLIRR